MCVLVLLSKGSIRRIQFLEQLNDPGLLRCDSSCQGAPSMLIDSEELRLAVSTLKTWKSRSTDRTFLVLCTVGGESEFGVFLFQPEDLQRHRHPFRLQRVLGDVDRHFTRYVETRTGTRNGSGEVAGRLPLVLDSHTAYCTAFPPTCQEAPSRG